MKDHNEKIPDPKELEKEISEFLAKKFGENVKIVSPMVMTREATTDETKEAGKSRKKLHFDLKPGNSSPTWINMSSNRIAPKPFWQPKYALTSTASSAPWNPMIPSATWSAASRTMS